MKNLDNNLSRNYKLIIAYDGTKYSGWQRLQNNIEKSIQGKIEITLSKILDENIVIIGSGRTDAGVHAISQVANFTSNKNIRDLDSFLKDINHYLPEDIKIKNISEVNNKFHSRFNARSKIYMYRIDNSQFGDPFIRKFAYFIDPMNNKNNDYLKLNLENMKKIAEIFIGEHDFTTFSKLRASSKKEKLKSAIRTISSIDFKSIGNNNIFEIYFQGDGFLYNMVRMIVGAIITGGLIADNIKFEIFYSETKNLLENKSREVQRFVVPPQGLFLYEVLYD